MQNPLPHVLSKIISTYDFSSWASHDTNNIHSGIVKVSIYRIYVQNFPTTHAHKERIIPRAAAVFVLTHTVELQIGFAKVELNRDKFNLRTNEEAFCFPFCLPLSPPFPHWPIPGYQFAAEFIVGSSVHRIFKLMAPNRAYKFPLRKCNHKSVLFFFPSSLLRCT